MYMSSTIDGKTLSHALSLAKITDFSGEYQELGGGEVNDTYKIHLADTSIILRIAKDEGQPTLVSEAQALQLLNSAYIPKLIYFDDKQLVNNRYWILETYLPGKPVKRLSPAQFHNLGRLLATIHRVPGSLSRTDLRQQFLSACRTFGDERKLLHHPDPALRRLIIKAFYEFNLKQPLYDHVRPSLTHMDVTPSNILVNGDDVALIDWEFSKFNDPMADFSTLYYEDIEYNHGKWRIKIEPHEKQALFAGYESNGGQIDEDRIKFWITFDKLSAAVFLYWRIHESQRITSREELDQYQLDFNNLVRSLS